LLLSIAMILGGCVTPVIPLPPPRFEDLSFALSGTDGVVIKGAVNANLSGSWVFVVNSRAGRGAMVNAADDGSFETDPISAQDRDKIHLWAAPSYYEATGDVTCMILDFKSGKPARCSQ
jgi:hypothetical protein